MAALVEGHKYGLSSFSPSNSHISAFHVKLTDSALRAIEEFQKIKDATQRRPKIQFDGNEGTIKVPTKRSSADPEGYRIFGFACSSIQGDPKGSLDCAKQQVSHGGREDLVSLGALSQKIVVRASDDVFNDTKKKMTLADEESKKQCAKEIKPSGPYIGKRIKKVVKREHLDLHLTHTATPASSSHHPPHKGSTHHGGQSSAVTSSRSSPLHAREGPVTLHGGPVNSSVIHLPFRDRIIHLLAIRPFKKPEILARLRKDGIRDRDKDSMGGILQQVATFNPRDNSYSLQKHLYEGVRDDWPGYSPVDKQLLKRRRPVESPTASTSPVPSVSPAHSNCSQASSPTNPHKRPSSVLSDSAPTAASEALPALKKPRIAHERRDKRHHVTTPPATDGGSTADVPPRSTEVKMRSPDVKPVSSSSPEGKKRSPPPAGEGGSARGKVTVSPPRGKPISPDSTTPLPEVPLPGPPTTGAARREHSRERHSHRDRKKETPPMGEEMSATEASSTTPETMATETRVNNNKQTPNYVMKFPRLKSLEERSRYKETFVREYEEYKQLHKNVEVVTERFKQMERDIRAVKRDSDEYEMMKGKIVSEYRLIKGDRKYKDLRVRWEYLHAKLGHIKARIAQYDQAAMAAAEAAQS